MAKSQLRSKKKPSGGKLVKGRKKKLYELGRDPTLTKLGEVTKRVLRIRSGVKKEVLLTANIVNVFDGKTHKKVKIKTVLANPANRHYVGRNILTKGTVVDTELGKVRITSRPGQEGTLSGVIVKEEK